MKVLATTALFAVLLAACAPFTVTPAAPDMRPYNKQFDGRFGGDPRVDAMSKADRDRALAEDAKTGVSKP